MAEDLHKILEAYHSDNSTPLFFYGTGLLLAFGGFIFHSTATEIYGATLTGAGLIHEGLEYYKAYCSAHLDFMKNGKFTRLEEDEE